MRLLQEAAIVNIAICLQCTNNCRVKGETDGKYGDDVIAQVWDRVVKVVNKLNKTHDKYGYVMFKEGMNRALMLC